MLTPFQGFFTTSPLNFAALNWPYPADAYSSQWCGFGASYATSCQHIVKDSLSMQLNFPETLREMFPSWSRCKFKNSGVVDPPKTLPADGIDGIDDLPGPLYKPKALSASKPASASAMFQSIAGPVSNSLYTEPAVPAQGINDGPLSLPRPTPVPKPQSSHHSATPGQGRSDEAPAQQEIGNSQVLAPGSIGVIIHDQDSTTVVAILRKDGSYDIMGTNLRPSNNGQIILSSGTVVSVRGDGQLLIDGQVAKPSVLPATGGLFTDLVASSARLSRTANVHESPTTPHVIAHDSQNVKTSEAGMAFTLSSDAMIACILPLLSRWAILHWI
ncbi:hypothetical protein BT63DRAFT_429727 [Microthyrium microscopicum]|uniref:Uncharacterized protein n=1 Tax=Microthyrium microscopicum TaxID=703497 RepID=A0A6A6TYG9_9PEZI|nr:hypothetical protein BT63DRAFT_429727 [Microthyrium microscopicum]